MNLYRLVSEEEWLQSLKDGKVPRCNSDKRSDHIHLNKLEDVRIVANKYYEPIERPVLLEVEISSELNKKLLWEKPNDQKNWEQANLKIDNIDMKDVKRYCYLGIKNEKLSEFEITEFSNL